MKYFNTMPREQFLDYCETHSKTPRKLFSKEQISQLLDLAGYAEKAEKFMVYGTAWQSVDLTELVAEARTKTE